MTTWPHTRYSLLARLADADDGAAWQTFERVYQPAIYRYARSRNLQEADALEVVQEVMVAVHKAMDSWKPSQRAGSFRAWLAEAARRITLQTVRKRDRRDRAVGGSDRGSLELVVAAPTTTSDEEDLNRWRFFCAAAAVERDVHPSTWRAFWLTAVENRPAASVARELGFSVGNVYSAKCRVLDRIRKHVQESSDEGDDA